MLCYRAKHPTKVHLWAGISKRGSTGICIFDGIMDKIHVLYMDIFNQTLVSFILSLYPDGHRFMADNDPKHTSNAATEFLEEKGVFWWHIPAESPDLNPIENLWHELKINCCVFFVLFLLTDSIVSAFFFLFFEGIQQESCEAKNKR